MNFSKKNHEIVRQNDANVKKSQKHDVNLQKNTTLYFQIGLILTLLVVYGMFEMNFESKPIEIVYAQPDDTEEYMFNKKVKVFEEIAPKVEKKKQKPVRIIEPIISDNDDTTKAETETVITEPSTTDKPPIKPEDVAPIIDEPEDINIMAVEHVPVYPGCEELNSNLERRACMEQNLAKLIDRKFDKDIASEYGLTGIQKIYVQFKIDKSGNVVDIISRAPHKALEKEAKKVIAKVPKMQPGKQAKKPVNVIYTLPILFKVQD